MGHFYIDTPVVNMRKSPTVESTVISQARFGEKIEVLDKSPGWIHIRTPDGYPGWIPESHLIERNSPYNPSIKVSRLAAHIYHVKDTEYGPILTLPYGSKLELAEDSDSRWIQIRLLDEKLCYIQKGDVAEGIPLLSKKDLTKFGEKFLDLPYTWGGRTSFGFDCSGFVQMLYEQIGINLLRDSSMQIQDRRFRIITKEELQPGDLIFWGKSPEKIFHVGMYLGNDTFIHSVVSENKPWIRISNLEEPFWQEGSPGRPYRAYLQWIDQKNTD